VSEPTDHTSGMSNFGVLVLVLGDGHIPHRAAQIPPQLQRMLVPGKMQHVIGTGNVDPALVAGLSPNVHLVAGDWDNVIPGDEHVPETQVLTVGAFRIGVIHGHQLLPWHNHQKAVERLQRKLQVDIMITGNTHQSFVREEKNYYHINPVGVVFTTTTDGGNVWTYHRIVPGFDYGCLSSPRQARSEDHSLLHSVGGPRYQNCVLCL
jgi:vacuolar protein sorting-associated protein 29